LRAASGDAEAQCILGDSYYDGKGVPQDYTQTAFWWHKAAEQGYANAQYNLGDSYHDGQGVPQDDTQAAFWFRKAAEQGDAEAQDALGVLCDYGQDMHQDYAQAALWFRKAAEQGDSDAQYDLGTWYKEGVNQGAPQDDTQTALWRRKIRAWRAYVNSVDFHNSEHLAAIDWESSPEAPRETGRNVPGNVAGIDSGVESDRLPGSRSGNVEAMLRHPFGQTLAAIDWESNPEAPPETGRNVPSNVARIDSGVESDSFPEAGRKALRRCCGTVRASVGGNRLGIESRGSP
jgi:hypothetical protein